MTDVGAVSGSTSKASSSLVNFSKDFDSFLLLLTQQLKNQDPLKPMDATEFTTQLVQFTNVEQQIQHNKNLESLIALQGDVQTASAMNYLGKTVDIDGNSIQLIDGKGTINYSLEKAAKEVTVTITDAAGNVIRTEKSDGKIGSHYFEWNGRNNVGNQVPDGEYKVTMKGVDQNGADVTVKTQAYGVVSNVNYIGGKVVLSVGNTQVPLSDVTGVRETPKTSENGGA